MAPFCAIVLELGFSISLRAIPYFEQVLLELVDLQVIMEKTLMPLALFLYIIGLISVNATEVLIMSCHMFNGSLRLTWLLCIIIDPCVSMYLEVSLLTKGSWFLFHVSLHIDVKSLFRK